MTKKVYAKCPGGLTLPGNLRYIYGVQGRANRRGRVSRFGDAEIRQWHEWREQEGLSYPQIAERAGAPTSTVYDAMQKEKGPVPTNGNEANERIPGERLELSLRRNSTSPATPSATAEERA